jgi:hypothetical protein
LFIAQAPLTTALGRLPEVVDTICVPVARFTELLLSHRIFEYADEAANISVDTE